MTLLLFLAAAHACSPIPGFLELTWTSECLVVTPNSPFEPMDSGLPAQELVLGYDPNGYDLHLINLCEEPIVLFDDCGVARCPFDLRLDPGETHYLPLAAAREPGQETRYVSVDEGGEERVLTVFNEGELTEDCYGPWGPCGCQASTPTSHFAWLRRRRPHPPVMRRRIVGRALLRSAGGAPIGR